MVTSITDEEAGAFVAAMRGSGDVDKKVDLLNEWALKLDDVSELSSRAVEGMIMATGPCLRSTAHLLVTSSLTVFLPPFLPLVPPAQLPLVMKWILPGLVEKLNDPKERFHNPARECLALVGGKAYASESLSASHSGKGKDKDGVVSQWESAIQDALGGRGARAKLESLKLLLQMRNDGDVKLPLKPWLSSLVYLLEDSDGAVRDEARETVVALLSPASTPPAARAEFKKLMLARNVRKSIADGILARVLGGAGAPSTPSAMRPGQGGSAESTRAPTPAADDIDIVYIASARDLDNEFKAMVPHFEGKETEHNWGPRERAIIRIRGMLRGQVFSKHPDAFVSGLRSGIVDGVSRTALSLRTTLAQHSCALVQELAEHLGPAFDPLVEPLLPSLGKMAGLTKRMIAERSQKAVTSIIKHSTIHPRILVAHIGAAVGDKSVQARQYGATHLRTFLESPAAKNISASDAALLDQVEQLVKRSLADTNPGVREQGRSTYWSFERLFPQSAAAIMATLDGAAKRQLQKVKDGSAVQPAASVARPSPKPRASSAMSAMIAAKRAQAAAERAQAQAAAAISTTPDQSYRELPDPQVSSSLDETANTPPTPPSTQEYPSEAHADTSPLSQSQARSDHRPTTPSTQRSHSSPHLTPTRLPRLAVSPGSHVASPPAVASPASVSPTVQKQSTGQNRIARLSRDFVTPGDDARISGRSSQGRSSLHSYNGKATTSPVSRPSVLPRPIGAVMSGASSDTSARSRSSSLARTLSRSPPVPADSPLQTVRPSANSAASARRGSATRGMAAPRPMTSSRSHAAPPPPLISENSYFPHQDPAEEARHAQAQQGLSAAKQLLEFDDDDAMIPTAPMTPMRAAPGKAMSALSRVRGTSNGIGPRGEWEDSPMPMSPKLIHKLEQSGHERSWWTARRKLLEAASSNESTRDGNIRADVEALRQPSPENLQRIARFSSANPIVEGDDKNRDIWKEDQLFNHILDGLLPILDPEQPAAVLEQALVTLWQLVQNQWELFEEREEQLWDRLFNLRLSSDHTVLESTNAMVSLLTEVCHATFLLLQLDDALDRFLKSHGGTVNSPESARVRSAGFTYALNAMGMCILNLPVEAVEGEARKRGHLVVQSLRSDLAISSRQAGNRFILAVQCKLEDDARTLSAFPGLTSTQRDFATYQMSQEGLLTKAISDVDKLSRRQSLHVLFVDGLAKGSRVR